MILTGWKRIAQHLGYSVRTVQRWEKRGLPVRRISYGARSPVVSDSEELEHWLLRGRLPQEVVTGSASNVRESVLLRSEAQRSRQKLHQNVTALKTQFAALRHKLARWEHN